jgi:hypothetical protein
MASVASGQVVWRLLDCTGAVGLRQARSPTPRSAEAIDRGVRLDNLAAILERVIDTVDHTPSLVEAFRSRPAHRRSVMPLADRTP